MVVVVVVPGGCTAGWAWVVVVVVPLVDVVVAGAGGGFTVVWEQPAAKASDAQVTAEMMSFFICGWDFADFCSS